MSLEPAKFIDQLRALGLTSGQARAYLAVAKLGPSTVVQVARTAHLQRTEIYSFMSRLVRLGLVEETLDRPKRYRVENPRVAIHNLAQQTIKQLKDVATAAEEVAAKSDSFRGAGTFPQEPEVRVITGWDRQQKSFFELLTSAEKEVWMIAGRQPIIDQKGFVLEEFLKILSSKGLRARLITQLDEITVRIVGKQAHLVEIRHSQNVPSHVYGFDRRAVVVGLTNSQMKDRNRISQILVTHPKCVEIMHDFFDVFWEQSIPLEVWMTTREQDRGTYARRTVIWGRKQLYRAVADWHMKARERILDYMPTENGPGRVVQYLRESFKEAHNRGIMMRSLCHISSTNLAAVREMCKFAEVRHTEASPGMAFAVLDNSEAVIQYIQADTSDKACPSDISIYVTEQEGVRRLGEMFNLMWEHSTPAETRIRELSRDQSVPAGNPATI